MPLRLLKSQSIIQPRIHNSEVTPISSGYRAWVQVDILLAHGLYLQAKEASMTSSQRLRIWRSWFQVFLRFQEFQLQVARGEEFPGGIELSINYEGRVGH